MKLTSGRKGRPERRLASLGAVLMPQNREGNMRKTFLRAFVALSVSTPVGAQSPAQGEDIFAQGLNAGAMLASEREAADAFWGLELLQNVPGTEQYRTLLVSKMNTALFAMSFVDRDVTMRPESLRGLVKISSPNMKEAMTKLRRARIANKWQSTDSKQEERIDWVLDRYVKTGNVFGFE